MERKVLEAVQVLLEYVQEKLQIDDREKEIRERMTRMPYYTDVIRAEHCECGNPFFFIDNTILTSNPPRQNQMCSGCGKIRQRILR